VAESTDNVTYTSVTVANNTFTATPGNYIKITLSGGTVSLAKVQDGPVATDGWHPFDGEFGGDGTRYALKISASRANMSLAGACAIGGSGNSCSVTIPHLSKMAKYGESVGTITKVGDMAVNDFATNGNNITGITSWRVSESVTEVVFSTSATLTSGVAYRFTGAINSYILLDMEL
jgi:hypothetical protein